MMQSKFGSNWFSCLLAVVILALWALVPIFGPVFVSANAQQSEIPVVNPPPTPEPAAEPTPAPEINLQSSGQQEAIALKQLYTVTGVKVDVREKDAALAKLKAISDAQIKAFAKLVRRLASPAAAKTLSGLGRREIGRMMASLSVESERTGPGRYIGKLTVRFLPEKVRTAFSNAGISFTEQQSPKIVILPVWNGPQGPVVWRDNPWRQAWINLKAENAIVPVIIPLGDLTDSQAISVEEALAGHETKLGSIKFRYQAEAILVAVATPKSKTELQAVMTGASPLGQIDFDKTYKARADEDLNALAGRIAARFHTVMIDKWKKEGGQPALAAGPPQSFAVSVPFSSVAEWNNIRIELLTTPGVTGVDVSSISDNGAIVQLSYTGAFPALQNALRSARLNLGLYSGQWVLQPF